ncbi:MAG: Lrp/AsnC family transcriptional regulator [DPANN group archaeon]|nr:Lrp/AsnC family transcriptional regulator [DPANN group archaeon]
MDDTDRKIVKALQEDSSGSMRQISRITGVALTTVHSRLRALKEKGVIRRYTLDIDHDKLGYHVLAIVNVTIGYDFVRKTGTTQNELVQLFMQEDEVEEAFSVTGETDIILKVRARGIDDLNNYLIGQVRKLPGVTKTVTQVVLYEGRKQSINKPSA